MIAFPCSRPLIAKFENDGDFLLGLEISTAVPRRSPAQLDRPTKVHKVCFKFCKPSGWRVFWIGTKL